MDPADYVLSVPRKEAADELQQAIDAAAQAVLFLVVEGLEKTQQKFNG